MSFSLQLLNKYYRNFLAIRVPSNFVRYATTKTPTTENAGNCEKSKTQPKKKTKTPKGRLDDSFDDAPPVFNEKEPLQVYPNNVNPKTGEIGGPKGKFII